MVECIREILCRASWLGGPRWPSDVNGSFDIYLRHDPDRCDQVAYGRVTTGLELLKAAARLHNVAKAAVMDCGLVIPTNN